MSIVYIIESGLHSSGVLCQDACGGKPKYAFSDLTSTFKTREKIKKVEKRNVQLI